MRTLFALCVTYAGKSSSLYFESFEDLLAARGSILSLPIAGLEVGEDDDIRTIFMSSKDDAASHVRLWVESLGAAVTEGVALQAPVSVRSESPKVVTGEEPVRKSGLTHKEETLHMLLRPEGVTLDQIMERFGILRDSASAIISTTCSKFGYTPHRSDSGVYTATKGREDGRGAAKKAAPKEPEVHVLGRRRRIAEARTN